jgi:hypothetical protein
MKNLLRLTEFWYEFVGQDHHKDRDCHFYINQVWSYGRPPVYRVEHYGYISELTKELESKTFDKFDEAYEALYDWLNSEIQDVFKFYEDRDPEKDNVLEKYKDLKQ